jgi:hypothetical protein
LFIVILYAITANRYLTTICQNLRPRDTAEGHAQILAGIGNHRITAFILHGENRDDIPAVAVMAGNIRRIDAGILGIPTMTRGKVA